MFSFSDQIVIEINFFSKICLYLCLCENDLNKHSFTFPENACTKVCAFLSKWPLRKRVLKMAYKRSIILKYISLNEGMTFNLNKLGPVVKKLKLGKVYNNNINDKDKEWTNFEKFYYNMQQKFKM